MNFEDNNDVPATGSSDDLGPAERRAFEALPREMQPPRHLEDRVVAALRERGTLPTPITAARRRSPVGNLRFWVPAAAAAAVAIFASGFAAGQFIGTEHGADIAVRGSQSAAESAARIQQAGSLYVAALASLSQSRDSTAPAAANDSARVIALRVLGEAAEEMALIAPDDPLAAAVLRGLNQRARQNEPPAQSRSVIWY